MNYRGAGHLVFGRETPDLSSRMRFNAVNVAVDRSGKNEIFKDEGC